MTMPQNETVIHTKTLEEFEEVIKYAKSIHCENADKINWNDYREETCIRFCCVDQNGTLNIFFGNRTFYKPQKIISYEEFFHPVFQKVNSVDSKTKLSNPKDLIGSDKLPLHLFPTTAIAQGSLALLDGALKYGRTNYRAVGVRASIYHDACLRHMTKWFEGEEVDEDSGVDHLAHAIACIAILIDAKAADKLNDDRMIEGGYLKMLKDLTPKVAELKKKHADKSPKHYDISDNKK